jgi:hypothetical protein
MLFVSRLIALCHGRWNLARFSSNASRQSPGNAQTTFWQCEYIKFK